MFRCRQGDRPPPKRWKSFLLLIHPIRIGKRHWLYKPSLRSAGIEVYLFYILVIWRAVFGINLIESYMDRRSKIATFDSNFNMTTAVFYSHTSLPAVIIKPSYTLMLLQSRAHFHIAPNVLRKSCSNLQTDCISHFPNPKLHKYKIYI